MTYETDPSSACMNYGNAVSDFIAACANHGAASPIEQWRWLHRSAARLHAVAVEYSLMEGMKLDWPSCPRLWPDMDEMLCAYRLDIEVAVQSLSSVEPRQRIEEDVWMPDRMPAYSASIPVLLDEMRCNLMGIHASLLTGYAWWLLDHGNHKARACACWRRTFEAHWGVPALSFLKVAHTLSSLPGNPWR